MCSYPCFGLSKTGFTPPSQLLKLIFLKKTKTASLPMQKSAAKTASLPIQKSAAKTASLPMQKSAAKTESSIHIYIYFLLGVYKPSHMGQAGPSSRKKTKKMLCFHAYDQYPQNILNISFFWKINIWSFKMCFSIVFFKHKNYFLAFWIL